LSQLWISMHHGEFNECYFFFFFFFGYFSKFLLKIPFFLINDLSFISLFSSPIFHNRLQGLNERQIPLHTVNKLIILVTSPDFRDLKFVRFFFFIFPRLTTPPLLLKKLISRYYIPWSVKTNVSAVQIRVGSALKHWLEMQFEDFTPEMIVR
jgi:hypothetical protein